MYTLKDSAENNFIPALCQRHWSKDIGSKWLLEEYAADKNLNYRVSKMSDYILRLYTTITSFSTKVSRNVQVLDRYRWYLVVIACMGDKPLPLAKARGLSPRTGGHIMLHIFWQWSFFVVWYNYNALSSKNWLVHFLISTKAMTVFIRLIELGVFWSGHKFRLDFLSNFTRSIILFQHGLSYIFLLG